MNKSDKFFWWMFPIMLALVVYGMAMLIGGSEVFGNQDAMLLWSGGLAFIIGAKPLIHKMISEKYPDTKIHVSHFIESDYSLRAYDTK